MISEIRDYPHRRYNPLLGEYVLVSPHRTKRPWQGKTEATPEDNRPQFDPGCYLCPGNTRANGETNPEYQKTFVFTNDFSALLPGSSVNHSANDDLFIYETVQGVCRVICFSPRHDLTLAEMSQQEIKTVVDLWAEQTAELGREYQWVQVFENRGEMMGSSNPHPHGQIWAQNKPPDLPAKEDAKQAQYFDVHKSRLLLDYAKREIDIGERVIVATESWLAVTPFWAVWPFETLILPLFPVQRMDLLQDDQRNDLALLLKSLLVKYDNLFEVSFPYSMGWHGAPFNDKQNDHWQLHAHVYPPLLRGATVRKFMVGYEMLGEPQRDITAEIAAERLRTTPDIHYKSRAQTTE